MNIPTWAASKAIVINDILEAIRNAAELERRRLNKIGEGV